MIEAPRIYPTFRFRNAAAMIDWLEKAFGFVVRAKYMDGDKVGHAELALGSSIIMCGDERDDAYGETVGASSGQGGKSLYVASDDIDTLYRRATAAGAAIDQEIVEKDYGSREFICRDPEGNVWCIGTYWPKVTDEA